jgi:hydrogenase nickel incorporation protein HypA/HybF
MHELSLMDSLGQRVLEVAAQQGAEQVLAIHLRIGSLSGVDPQALRFAAEVVLAGTCAEGAALTSEEIQAACWCDPCGAEFGVTVSGCVCPVCGALSHRLLRGRDLSLVSLDLIP